MGAQMSITRIGPLRAELRQTKAALKRCQKSLAAALAHIQWLLPQLEAAERRALVAEKKQGRRG